MSDRSPNLRDLAAGYVLGALTRDEADAFERALSEDDELRREVAELRETAAMLAAQNVETPPPALKERVLARIRSDKGADLAARRMARRSSWLAAGLAASVVMAGGLGLQVSRLRSTLATRDSVLAVRERRVADLERQRNAIFEPGVELTVLTRPGDRPPGIQIFRDRDRRLLMLHAFRMTPVSPGRAYQLWLLPRGGAPIPSHVFVPEPDGHYLAESIPLPADLVIEGYAITEEPAAGSPQPTTPILLMGTIAGP